MHAVIRQSLCPHRLESAGADMQGNEGGADAQRAQFRQQRVIEVQARRRRGDRAPLAGKHRLVTRLVGGLRGAFDVGRQGQASVALDLLQGVAEKRSR